MAEVPVTEADVLTQLVDKIESLQAEAHKAAMLLVMLREWHKVVQPHFEKDIPWQAIADVWKRTDSVLTAEEKAQRPELWVGKEDADESEDV